MRKSTVVSSSGAFGCKEALDFKAPESKAALFWWQLWRVPKFGGF